MHYFSQLNTSMRKGKDLEPDPDPYQVPLTNESRSYGSGRPKNMRILFRIQIPNTAKSFLIDFFVKEILGKT